MNNLRLLLGVILITFLISSPGCSKKPSPSANIAASESGAETQTYQIRGVIMSLPAPGPPPVDLRIHHEHIPDFVGMSGEINQNKDGSTGMRAMVMPFPHVAEDIDLGSFAAGDKIKFALAITWRDSAGGGKLPILNITEMTKLPADAEISFENKPAP